MSMRMRRTRRHGEGVDENKMSVKCIFYSEFDPVAGPVITYQVSLIWHNKATKSLIIYVGTTRFSNT